MLLPGHTARSISHSTRSAHTPQHALHISRCAGAAHCPLLLLFTVRTTAHSTAAAGCCVLLPCAARTAHSPAVSVPTQLFTASRPRDAALRVCAVLLLPWALTGKLEFPDRFVLAER